MAATYAQVLLPRPFYTPFDYAVPEDLDVMPGAYVRVPFSGREMYGVVWGVSNECRHSPTKIKKILDVSVMPPMPDVLRSYIMWVADYTLSAPGSVLAMAMSVTAALEEPKKQYGYQLADKDSLKNIKLTSQRQAIIDFFTATDNRPLLVKDLEKEVKISAAVIRSFYKIGGLEKVVMPDVVALDFSASMAPSQTITLSDEQALAAENLCTKIGDQSYSVTAIEGVTGSGKTEVYLEAVHAALEQGKQALILLPEIALTTQLTKRFEERLGISVHRWHSALTQAQRRDNWRAIVRGEARVIVGARSALFLPCSNLGLIVVDEEHEGAWKQEDGVIYHGRDMAVARAFHEKIPAVLLSASPSIETVVNVESGKFDGLYLHSRHGEAVMPDINVVDMRTEMLDAQHWISNPLKSAIAEHMSRGEQTLLYLNRRGYAPLTLCRKCGHRFQCPDCTAWLVLHKKSEDKSGNDNGGKRMGWLQCHQCGHSVPEPEQCPECSSDKIAVCGPGVERLEEEVNEIFPEARVAVVTTDHINGEEGVKNLIETIECGGVDIIIGTQMIAKGYHFPHLTLVGVVDADMGLEGGDLRAAERSFQLLQQVSGRAGREEKRGQAIIQSYMPEHGVIHHLAHSSRADFIRSEIARRKQASMPPFGRMAALIISASDEGLVKQATVTLAHTMPRLENVRVLGPAPAPLYLLRGQYRHRFLLISPKTVHMQKLIRAWLRQARLPSGVRCRVDIDPYNFL